ncbi:hypothetical protein [Vagococcus acidifermentans]|uniref:Uncharacterized protein n=1 Tax=Vagococcus acidifermentans TaxID=564710 RepID=A0A430AML5_9ENTE|nr:hypothetical protein [Vagococcus acidifermentans]RSU09147.1 hypothetical protein CBF27_13225 [Vagococcus acidifermentans]
MTKQFEKMLLIILVFFGLGMIVYAAVIKSDSFLAFEMLLGIIILFVPKVVSIIFKLEVPSMLKILYWVFIFFAVFIGTGLSFYSKITIWDKLLHFSSAMLLVALGFAIIGYFIPQDVIDQVPAIVYTIFGFTFGMTVGVFWEFYEFLFDGILEMNMQRFALSNGMNLVGRDALLDTMGDLFVNTLGCFVFAAYCYFLFKQDAKRIENLSFKKVQPA